MFTILLLQFLSLFLFSALILSGFIKMPMKSCKEVLCDALAKQVIKEIEDIEDVSRQDKVDSEIDEVMDDFFDNVVAIYSHCEEESSMEDDSTDLSDGPFEQKAKKRKLNNSLAQVKMMELQRRQFREKRLLLEKKRLLLEEKQFLWAKEVEERKLALEELKIKNDFKVKQLKLESKERMEQLELELKFKDNK